MVQPASRSHAVRIATVNQDGVLSVLHKIRIDRHAGKRREISRGEQCLGLVSADVLAQNVKGKSLKAIVQKRNDRVAYPSAIQTMSLLMQNPRFNHIR